jgi:glucose/arabinose dehydrogenase/PKD repeat protein
MNKLIKRACVGALCIATLALPSGAAAQGSPPPDSNFDKVVLDQTPGEPMDVAVLPDGSVLHATRQGHVWHHDAKSGLKTLAARLDVYQHDEEGLQNIALDPNFEKNGRIYLYYSPPLDTPLDDPATPTVNEGDAPFFGTEADWERFRGYIQLSRFQWNKKSETIDLGSEEEILEVPVDRGICCHVGGDIVFDGAGNLYLSTGDDTNPFQSDGYTPIDEREGRNPAFDAQRTSANTNDLRGKVLRITPKAGGGYTIPQGNLFPEGTEGTRPEIYLMGLRNPFRIEYNTVEGELYVADYSPDARNANSLRGPAGQGKWFIATEPGNYGWPYCATAELPYVDYDFATGASGATFDCANPVNESPNNTGLTDLPEVTQPQVWYSYGLSAEFPELGTGGIGPMAGPAYQFDARTARAAGATAWPAYYDNVPLFYEWTRDYIKEFRLDADRDEVAEINGVLDPFDLQNPIDIEFGPNGSLYVLNYGNGFFGQNQPGAELARIDHIGPGGNHAPTVTVAADDDNGLAPHTVHFTAAVDDPDGDRVRYEWDFEGDGKVDSRVASPTFTYTENGLFRATLKVTDQRGRSASDYVEILVGNTPPVVELLAPQEGDTFSFGDAVQFEVRVTDDQPVDCSRVQVTYILGHDTHGHPQTTAFGCTGTIQTSVPAGHDPNVDDLSGVFVAQYTDDPGDDLPGLTGEDEVVLEPAG